MFLVTIDLFFLKKGTLAKNFICIRCHVKELNILLLDVIKYQISKLVLESKIIFTTQLSWPKELR